MPILGKIKNLFVPGSTGSGDGKKKSKFPLIKQDADPNELWENVGELGDGAFGKVYKAEHKVQRYYAALKQVDIASEDDLEEYSVEIDILHQCKHKNVVGIFESYLAQDKLWMYIEFCELGALDGIMMELDRPLTEPQIKYICREMCEGLDFLHNRLVIHRDLKAGNVLLTSSGSVRLADFGVSAKNTSPKQRRDSFIGTPYWMAPEVILCETIKDSPYDYMADIWSFGITLIECSQMDPPNHEMHPMRVVLKVQKSPPPTLTNPHHWSKEFNDFLKMCLQKEPDRRSSAAELLQHSFIREVEGKAGIEDLLSELNADVTLEEKDIDEDLDQSPDSDSGIIKSSDDDKSLKLEDKFSDPEFDSASSTATTPNTPPSTTSPTTLPLSTTTAASTADITTTTTTTTPATNTTAATTIITTTPATPIDKPSSDDKLAVANAPAQASSDKQLEKTKNSSVEIDTSLLRNKRTHEMVEGGGGGGGGGGLERISEAANKGDPETKRMRKKTLTKTRRFIVNGEVKTSQVHKVVGNKVPEEHKLWKADLRELKQLHRQENRQLQEMELKSMQALEEQARKFEQDYMSLRSHYDSQLESMAKQHRQFVDKMLNNHVCEKKNLTKKIKNEQEKDSKLMGEGLKQDLKLLKQEVDMLAKDARKEAYAARKQQKEREQAIKWDAHRERQRGEMAKAILKLEDQQAQQYSLSERQFLQQKQQALKARETAFWDLEERHIMEKFQLSEQQLKNKFILKRAHMMTRHSKETDQIRRINSYKEEELATSHAQEWKRLPKILKADGKTRALMYRESIRISICNITMDQEKEKIKQFDEQEKKRARDERRRLELKHIRQREELKAKNQHLLRDLEQVHADKQRMLLENEMHKTMDLSNDYQQQLNCCKEHLEPRKKQLELLFEDQLKEQLNYLNQRDYASASNITAASTITPLVSRKQPPCKQADYSDDEGESPFVRPAKRGSGVMGVLKLRDSFRSSKHSAAAAGVGGTGGGLGVGESIVSETKEGEGRGSVVMAAGREVLILRQEDFVARKEEARDVKEEGKEEGKDVKEEVKDVKEEVKDVKEEVKDVKEEVKDVKEEVKEVEEGGGVVEGDGMVVEQSANKSTHENQNGQEKAKEEGEREKDEKKDKEETLKEKETKEEKGEENKEEGGKEKEKVGEKKEMNEVEDVTIALDLPKQQPSQQPQQQQQQQGQQQQQQQAQEEQANVVTDTPIKKLSNIANDLLELQKMKERAVGEVLSGGGQEAKKDVDVSSGNVEVGSGNVDVGSGNVDVGSGNVDVGSGNVDVSSGNVDVGSGNVDVGSGNVDVGSGNVDVGGGNVDVGGGNVDVGSGNVEVGSGNVDVGSGNVDVGSGNVDVGSGNVDVGSGNVDVGSGNVDVGSGNVDVGSGNVDVGSGNVDVGSGNIDVGSVFEAKPFDVAKNVVDGENVIAEVTKGVLVGDGGDGRKDGDAAEEEAKSTELGDGRARDGDEGGRKNDSEISDEEDEEDDNRHSLAYDDDDIDDCIISDDENIKITDLLVDPIAQSNHVLEKGEVKCLNLESGQDLNKEGCQYLNKETCQVSKKEESQVNNMPTCGMEESSRRVVAEVVKEDVGVVVEGKGGGRGGGEVEQKEGGTKTTTVDETKTPVEIQTPTPTNIQASTPTDKEASNATTTHSMSNSDSGVSQLSISDDLNNSNNNILQQSSIVPLQQEQPIIVGHTATQSTVATDSTEASANKTFPANSLSNVESTSPLSDVITTSTTLPSTTEAISQTSTTSTTETSETASTTETSETAATTSTNTATTSTIAASAPPPALAETPQAHIPCTTSNNSDTTSNFTTFAHAGGVVKANVDDDKIANSDEALNDGDNKGVVKVDNEADDCDKTTLNDAMAACGGGGGSGGDGSGGVLEVVVKDEVEIGVRDGVEVAECESPEHRQDGSFCAVADYSEA